jgi:hypothetical protein
VLLLRAGSWSLVMRDDVGVPRWHLLLLRARRD